MLNSRRKQRILEKLAAEKEKMPTRGTNTVLRILGSNLGFGAVKANKQTAKTVPGQEVLHSGGRWPHKALAEQEARIGIRPNLPPPPGAADMSKNASFAKIRTFLKGGKTPGRAPAKKSLTAFQKREVKLGLRNADGTPVRVTTGDTSQWARVGA